jgi:polyphosphate glucokinase
MSTPGTEKKILSIDIGGSRIKATILDIEGKMLMDYERIQTPPSPGPEDVIKAIVQLTKGFQPYNRISAGFPGYVRGGVVYTAPNLGTEKWRRFPFAKRLSEVLNYPARVVNDADMQGLGVASGLGLEMVITLGTGFGTALLLDGNLLPHLEIAHHPLSKRKTYDEYIGNKAFEDIGVEKWNKRLYKVFGILKTVFNYDHLYISGGNAKKIMFKLDDNMTVVTNLDGIKGGAKLWKSDDHLSV